MKVAVVIGLQIFVILLLSKASSQQTCETWVPINETIYSRTFTRIDDNEANSKRPLGFKVTVLKFVGGTPPCFVVAPTGGSMRHIEIKWELEQDGVLCVRVKGTTTGSCSASKTNSRCMIVPGGAASLQYEFYCQGTGCEGGDKLFWYRFVVESPMSDGMYDENWCDTRSSDYPASLAPLPNNFLPATTTTTTSSASRLDTFLIASILLTVVSALLIT